MLDIISTSWVKGWRAIVIPTALVPLLGPQKAKTLRRHRSSEQLFSEEHWPMGHGLRRPRLPLGAQQTIQATQPRRKAFLRRNVFWWGRMVPFWATLLSFLHLVGEISHDHPFFPVRICATMLMRPLWARFTRHHRRVCMSKLQTDGLVEWRKCFGCFGHLF